MDRLFRKAIVFSENLTRFLLRGESYLLRTGFDLLAGASGHEILDLAARRRPVAVVLAYDLGDLLADEVCRCLKKGPDPVPLVLIVGPAWPADIALRCGLAGCDEFLFAPPEPEALLARLSSHLGVRFRVHPRRPLVVPVAHGRFISEFLGHTRDLGEGGALVESSLRPAPGRRLFLRFHPDDPRALDLPSVVLRVEPSRDRDMNFLGMQFQPLQPTTRARLKDLLRGGI